MMNSESDDCKQRHIYQTCSISWMDQENELGKYEEMGTPTTDIDREEGQVTVDIPAKFDKGDAEIKVVFNYSSDYDQMVPAYMTISEVKLPE